MLDFYLKIQKVLSLEKARGFQNSAVAGGFGNFVGFIEQQGEKHHIQKSQISAIISYFKMYSSLSFDKRNSSINQILDWLSNKPINFDTQIQNRIFLLEKKENSKTNLAISEVQDSAIYADLRSIKGIGDRNYKYFEKLGIANIYNLLRYYPRRYQDYSQLKTIASLDYGEEITVAGVIKGDIYTRKSKRGNLKISEALLSDSTGTLKLIWFNQPFISKQLVNGTSIVVSGKVDRYLGRYVMNSAEWEPLDKEQIHTNRIVPIYPGTSGISQRQIRKIIKNNLNFWAKRVKEYLPKQLIRNEELPMISDALFQIHFPESIKALHLSQKRFALEEIFFLQIGVLFQKSRWRINTARKFSIANNIIKDRVSRLPYELTHSQTQAINDIQNDLTSGRPMNRLLQGDVGSGKTVVAKFAMEIIIDNNSQAAILAPTSILAEQHYITLSQLLVESGSILKDEVALLIGNTPQKEKQIILNNLLCGKIKCLIGTHALLEDPVIFKDLQIAIIDEQHRFGVNQRNILRSKGDNLHLLVMSATPIPRSLALTVYGDLDVTVIDEMPPGRKPVNTLLFGHDERNKAYDLISDQVQKGFQAFIVYPMINSDDDENTEELHKSAVKEHKRIQKVVFPNLNIGLLHGKLKQSEKDSIMDDFRKHKYDVLVSTTVIEVGVDIPDATIVLIESANHFGLAQLHQIRGRVGRNFEDSFCILIPDSDDAIENERLVALTQSNDGFELAEVDLKYRGPGEFLGTRQSGYAGFKFANISDIKLIETSRKYAQDIINNDPELNLPNHNLLKEQLIYFWPDLYNLV
jgi:ATP-dependent DNA helicase RecG